MHHRVLMRFRRKTFEVAPSALISPRRISNAPSLETILEEGNPAVNFPAAAGSIRAMCMVPLVLSLVSYALMNGYIEIL
ncbi:hypothetical protein DM860_003448 [Cuscuta australis]|uniref:Uncharacterized protein n=1 Tax=Cuscuta australis TaxID=267555 RepID=A0A328DK47_9ASTE|nr:hypothetical protein DM860_003448 [Cuscuta australis]